MQGNDVASLEQLVLALGGMHPGSLYGVGGAECVVCRHLHAESLGDACHVASHVAEGEDAQFLALQLRTSLAVVEVAHGEHQQSEHQFGNGVGVLSGCVLSHHVVSRGCGEVDVVVAGACTHHDLQVLGCVEHLGVHLV